MTAAAFLRALHAFAAAHHPHVNASEISEIADRRLRAATTLTDLGLLDEAEAEADALHAACSDIERVPLRKPASEIAREGYQALYVFPRSETP